MGLRLAVLEKRYSIHRFTPDSAIPERALQGEFYTVSRTEEELSIVCDSEIELEAMESQNNWRIIKVVGPLDFSLTGILAKISTTLASAEISIFALSTFDTDYILVKNENLEKARRALLEAAYHFL